MAHDTRRCRHTITEIAPCGSFQRMRPRKRKGCVMTIYFATPTKSSGDGRARARNDLPSDLVHGGYIVLRHQMMHIACIPKRDARSMRTTLNIDDALVDEARRLTGIDERTALIHEGLRALIARESARRLAALGGSEPRVRPVPRRRSG